MSSDEQKFHDRMRALTEAVGRRYVGCRLSNFAPANDAAASALASLEAYAKSIAEKCEEGIGVTLYGPCGTGKDHLAVALCRVAIHAGIRAEWCDAERVFSDLRGTFGSDARSTELDVLRRLERVPLLAISDPIPQSGELSDYQSRTLRRIIGARYADMRPTILTLNVANGEEAKQRLGAATYDRIRGSSLAIHCNWPSYRTAPK